MPVTEIRRQPAYAQFMEHYGATQERVRDVMRLPAQSLRIAPTGRSRHTSAAVVQAAAGVNIEQVIERMRRVWESSNSHVVSLTSSGGYVGDLVTGVHVWQQSVRRVDIGTVRGVEKVRAMALAKSAEQIFIEYLSRELGIGFRFQWDYMAMANTYHLIIHRMSDKEIVFENSYSQQWIGECRDAHIVARTIAEEAIHYIVGARREMALARKEFWSLYDGNGRVIKTWSERPPPEGVIEAITVGDTAPFALVRGIRTDVYDIDDDGNANRLGALSDGLPGDTPPAEPKRLVQIRG